MKKSTFGILATVAVLFTPVAAFTQDSQVNNNQSQLDVGGYGYDYDARNPQLSTHNKKMRVNFTTISRGYSSGYRTASQLVIASNEEWVDLWQQHSSNQSSLDIYNGFVTPSPVPEVDFTQEQVVAVFAGEKPTGGYSIEVISVETINSILVITVKHSQPAPENNVAAVITHPYHIIKIPRMTVEKVVFKQAEADNY